MKGKLHSKESMQQALGCFGLEVKYLELIDNLGHIQMDSTIQLDTKKAN